MNFLEITEKRYATKKFTGEKIPDEKIVELKKLIQNAASSFGLQPYTIVVVSSDEQKNALKSAAFDQEQIPTCSHLFIFCANTKVKERIDEYEQMLSGGAELNESAKGYIQMMRDSLENLSTEDITHWATKQTYIALSNAINGAKSLGFDSCPMEGFNPEEFAKILELPEHIKPVVLCPVGFAADEPRPKLRYSLTELFKEK
ncbi:MAG: NAD(P)H-dependent oxidoreductase [Candidatus Woesearchaeota archaeon]